MSAFSKEDVDRLIVDQRIDNRFPSIRQIFDVMHPILQSSVLEWAATPQTFLVNVRIPKPFDSWSIRYALFTRWGQQDRVSYSGPHNMFFKYDEKPHLLMDKSTVSEPSQVGCPNSDFPPLTKLIGLFGAFDEAAFIRHLASKTLLLDLEDSAAVAEFYHNRIRLMARIGAIATNLRLTDENIISVVERYNRLPHAAKVDPKNQPPFGN